MSAPEFAAMCTAFFAVYQSLIIIFSGAVAGTGLLAGVVLGIVMGIRRAFFGSP
jgi:hypothetical protein